MIVLIFFRLHDDAHDVPLLPSFKFFLSFALSSSFNRFGTKAVIREQSRAFVASPWTHRLFIKSPFVRHSSLVSFSFPEHRSKRKQMTE